MSQILSAHITWVTLGFRTFLLTATEEGERLGTTSAYYCPNSAKFPKQRSYLDRM